ncbi:MobV family relaxase [Vibrio parahaemolyticus]|uniref:MobV family relaxase n=1 Tax=Vibrio parahaemolyticus TaxID=670 RepID=UPI0024AEC04D|nr:MobV family relaxase [Vibrio parahaemolyticus]MDI7854629.1 plasmid recombination protein [Vibrio parahaemolyticus]
MSNLKTILRFEKIKDFKQLNLSNAHVQRYINTPNADGKIKNKVIYGSGNLVKDVKKEFNKRLNKKPRKGAVICMEAIFSLSPEYFTDQKSVVNFANAVVKYLNENFLENTMSVVLHLDESTPHIHAHITPITEDGRLSAFELFNKKTLRDFQKSYCETVKKETGLNFTYTEGSKAKHTDLKNYYGMVNEKLKPFKEENQSLKKDVSELQEKLFKEQEENLELSGKVESLEKTIKTQQEEISYLKKLVKRLESVVKKLKSRFSNKKKKSSDPYDLPKLTIENNPDVPKELQKNKRRNRPSI